MNEKNTPPNAGAGHVRADAVESFRAGSIGTRLGLSNSEATALHSLSKNKPAVFRAIITLANACATGAPDVTPLQLASAIDGVLTVATNSEGRAKVLRHLA